MKTGENRRKSKECSSFITSKNSKTISLLITSQGLSWLILDIRKVFKDMPGPELSKKVLAHKFGLFGYKRKSLKTISQQFGMTYYLARRAYHVGLENLRNYFISHNKLECIDSYLGRE